MIFKDTMRKHMKTPQVLQKSGEEIGLETVLVTAALSKQTVLILTNKNQLEQVPEAPRTGWTGREMTAVLL